MALALSPPPTTVTPGHSAIAAATASVPLANFGNSNTPMGPFQITVPALFTASPKSFCVSGPMSRPCQPAGMAGAATTLLSASAANLSATTTSTGSSSFTPDSSALASMFLQ